MPQSNYCAQCPLPELVDAPYTPANALLRPLPRCRRAILTSSMAEECTDQSVTDRHAAYFAGWHCSIAATATQGRHLIAVRDFARGETVVVSEAYLKALLPSHKKRICAGCMHDGGRRLPLHCSGCGQAWYCSDACRTADASGAAHQGMIV